MAIPWGQAVTERRACAWSMSSTHKDSVAGRSLEKTSWCCGKARHKRKTSSCGHFLGRLVVCVALLQCCTAFLQQQQRCDSFCLFYERRPRVPRPLAIDCRFSNSLNSRAQSAECCFHIVCDDCCGSAAHFAVAAEQRARKELVGCAVMREGRAWQVCVRGQTTTFEEPQIACTSHSATN